VPELQPRHVEGCGCHHPYEDENTGIGWGDASKQRPYHILPYKELRRKYIEYELQWLKPFPARVVYLNVSCRKEATYAGKGTVNGRNR
jgi:hypothetical protein